MNQIDTLFDKQIMEMEKAYIKSKSELFNWEVRLADAIAELKRKNPYTQIWVEEKIEEILEGNLDESDLLTLENIRADYQSLSPKTKLIRASFEVARIKKDYVDYFMLLKYTKNLNEKFLQEVA